jgi:hypothetical protein
MASVAEPGPEPQEPPLFALPEPEPKRISDPVLEPNLDPDPT